MCHGDETIDFCSFQSQHFFEIILSLLSIVIKTLVLFKMFGLGSAIKNYKCSIIFRNDLEMMVNKII